MRIHVVRLAVCADGGGLDWPRHPHLVER